jgi:hypothetical protein
MHLSDGEIRAFQDQELLPEARQVAADHLADCSACKSKAHAVQARALLIHERLRSLDPDLEWQNHLTTRAARGRLTARLSQYEREEQTMQSKLFSRIPRLAWAVITIVAVLAASLAFPQVRAVANSFLKLFRVEQVRVLPVNLESLPGNFSSSENAKQFEAAISDNLVVDEQGETQEVASAAEAATLVNFPVRLPSALQETPRLLVQPGAAATFTIDLNLAREMLKDLGRSDIQLPDSVDGTKIKIEMYNNVVAMYGDCQMDEQDKPAMDPDQPAQSAANWQPPKNCTTFFQTPSPSISAPPDLPVTQIGEAYLQLLGMNQEEAAQFANNVDWTTTFIIPVPSSSSSFEDVRVDGVIGTLINYHRYSPSYLLVWVKDGILYALGGPGGDEDALNTAASLK